MFHLDPDDPDAIAAHLAHRGLVDPDVPVHAVARAGEGNMNLVLRVRLDGRSVVVKQARPWVEKYPSIPAPPDRDAVEAAFYAVTATVPALRGRMPRLIDHDPERHILVFEDLGEGADLTDLYGDARLDDTTLDAILAWLEALHRVVLDPAPPVLANRAMRRLNHAHLFDLPFQAEAPADLDAITPGLGQAHATVADDDDLVRRIRALGRRYLADGTTLLHGDMYPGAWLRTDRGLAVLDPEFAFPGDPAFDRGVVVAHLVFAGATDRQHAWAAHDAPPGTHAFAGVEILRRLLGVAQLPLTADLATKQAWIGQAATWIREDT